MAQTSILHILVLAAVLPALRCVPAKMSRHQLALKEHYDHLAYIAQFECHVPQPRIIPVGELLTDYETRGKAYFPEVTVLHRCDINVGCCEGNQKCGPLHAEVVHLPFKVTFLEDMGDQHKGDWEMEYHDLDNHTACGCLDPETPKKPTTTVHVHYVDPSLMPHQNLLPGMLESSYNESGHEGHHTHTFIGGADDKDASKHHSHEADQKKSTIPHSSGTSHKDSSHTPQSNFQSGDEESSHSPHSHSQNEESSHIPHSNFHSGHKEPSYSGHKDSSTSKSKEKDQHSSKPKEEQNQISSTSDPECGSVTKESDSSFPCGQNESSTSKDTEEEPKETSTLLLDTIRTDEESPYEALLKTGFS